MATASVTTRMCRWHDKQRAYLREMYRDWGEDQEPRWVADMVAQCLDCQGVAQPVKHLSREMPDQQEPTPAMWPVSPPQHAPMTRRKRRMRAVSKRAVGRRRQVRANPPP